MDRYQTNQYNMRKNIVFICFIACFLCACKEEVIKFIPLTQFDDASDVTDNGRPVKKKHLNFIIMGFEDNKRVEKLTDSFALKTATGELKDYNSYSIVFYKHSDITDVEYLKSNPRDIDRYSQDHDMVYIYEWSNGKLLVKNKFNEGKMVSPRISIGIEDID